MSVEAVHARIVTIVRELTPTRNASQPFECVADGRGGHVDVEDLVARERSFVVALRYRRPTQHTGTGARADVVQALDVRVGYPVGAGGDRARAEALAYDDANDIGFAVSQSPANWAGDFDFARPAGDTVLEEAPGGLILRVPFEIGHAS